MLSKDVSLKDGIYSDVKVAERHVSVIAWHTTFGAPLGGGPRDRGTVEL